jgi:non-heme chloroperoxidase
MNTITTKDGTQIYFKDWGTGQPVIFSHGWPLSADAWDDQMLFLGERGYRVIAHDRRGHGRSSQPWNGNDLDTYADDVAELVAALSLDDAVHVGHSTGGGEVARYIARHGTRRVAKAVLIGAIPPLMLRTASNPGGLPIDVFDGIRKNLLTDRSQFFKDLSAPFYGANRPGAKVSQGLRDSFWLQGMQAGFKGLFDCVKAFSETDQTGTDAVHPRRRRPDRPDRRLGARRGEDCAEGAVESLPRGASRSVQHAQGSGERRPLPVPEGVAPWRRCDSTALTAQSPSTTTFLSCGCFETISA